MKKSIIEKLFISVTLASLLTSCGTTNDRITGHYNEWNGIFVDSVVSGVYWKCGNAEGNTSLGGNFGPCIFEEPVTFSIGGLTLGTSVELSSHIFTPHNLISGAKRDTTQNTTLQNDTIFKIASLLLSLDKDSNATNGIEITSAVEESLTNNIATLFPTVSNRTIVKLSQSDIESIVSTIGTSFNNQSNTNISYFNASIASTHLNRTVTEITSGTIVEPDQPLKVGGGEGGSTF